MYARTLTCGFVFDDRQYIINNPHVARGLTLDGISWAMTSTYAANWHPLTWISHMVDVSLFGQRPAGHHLVNILFHAANAVLLLLALSSATGALWRSAVVTALFAVHPLRTESVAWISERKDLLCATFFLLALLAYVRYVRRPAPSRYLLVAGLFALALAAKPMAVTLPFVLLLLDFWPLGRFRARRGVRVVVDKIPLLLLSAGSSFVTYLAQAKGGAVTPFLAHPLPVRAANALAAVPIYLRQTFLPWGLTVLYPFPVAGIAPTWLIIDGGMLLALTAFVVASRRSPALPVGWLWFGGMLAPVIGIVQIGVQSHADRYTYLPHIGLLVALAWGLCAFSRPLPQPLRSLAAGVILGALAAVTVVQTGYWKDNVTLWTRATAVTRGNWMAHANLGSALLARGDPDGALPHLQESLQVNPYNAEAHTNVGLILYRRGDVPRAIEHLSIALYYSPALAAARTNLAAIYAQTGRRREAERLLEGLTANGGGKDRAPSGAPVP